MEFKRKYLTSDEIIYITEEMKKKETGAEREIVKDALVAQMLIEDLGEVADCNSIYDLIFENEINLSSEVVNYHILDCIVREDIGVVPTLKEVLENLSKAITEVDLTSVISQLKDLPNQIENEETLHLFNNSKNNGDD